MKILQFLRIFWARRNITLIALVSTLLGAFTVSLLVQPRYEATARVLLNSFVRPDPVTGEMTGEQNAGPFLDSQIELIRGYSVTGRVVDLSGWLSDPGFIRAYAARPASDTRDFRRWLSQNVSDATVVKLSGSGSVLEITYRAPNAPLAAAGAQTILQAYLDASLAARHDLATTNAAFYNKQADAARQLAETAESAKAAYEKQTGIISDGPNADLDSERLASLSAQSAAPTINIPARGSAAALELAAIDAQLAEASKRLGPNNPTLLNLQARRNTIGAVAAQEAAAAKAAASGQSSAAGLQRSLQEQKSRVIGESEQVEKLRQLQAEADLRRAQYQTAAAKAAQYTAEAATTDTGLTPLGVVVPPTKPAFPNKPLMLGGGAALGFALGLSLSLLLELLNRHVRSSDDLYLTEDIRCLGVVEEPAGRDVGRRLRRALRGLIPGWAGAPT